ncbi:MAG: NUDIX hydrolase [Ruminiclostridium sp.]|nr:NUDIX hydrolase [Ruminiclostridium sp.]
MEFTEKQTASELGYKGKVIDVSSDTVLLENGKEAKRDVVRHPGGVCIVALTENNDVYMVRQFRYPHGKVLTEIPAGKLEWGENHLECGKRELHEETGNTADEFTYLGCLYPTPAYDTEVIHMYLAKGLHKDRQKLDEDEFLEAFTVPFGKAVEMVMNGEIEDAKTQIAILKTARLLGQL